ncbi:Uncharacterised protein [Chlamydia trachomatis]|nr:Uncharacterised protein [Chlamydia trachomatis]
MIEWEVTEWIVVLVEMYTVFLVVVNIGVAVEVGVY